MSAVDTLSGRLSLRPPQREALRRLSRALEVFKPTKNADPAAALALIKTVFPDLEDFERDFPSLCFELATGVGKTRLMGAFIAYLHTEHGLSNFFVLAPGTTIYEKLLQDFSPNTPKYVFRGLGEYAVEPPAVITAENYERALSPVYGTAPIRINLFNIQKINTEVRAGATPRIRRLSEYLGQSYFDMLAGLDDLVLIMDESHRYRGGAGIRALNELKPVLGLEVTATPEREQGNQRDVFKNIVYSYRLADAMSDGFVKEPAAATRKDLDPTAMGEDELERIKLEDAIALHEQVKAELALYAERQGLPRVKPFILVVAEDTTHAGEVEARVKDDKFFAGRYKDKVIQVHSNQTGEEKEDTVRRLLQVESASEPTEIVIHVNKLKEGWDVTNLYTIVPLRAARSRTLVQQTIGRGLRLPYGKRTGVPAIDTLTIVAHEHFQKIIEEAHKSGIFIRQLVLEGTAAAARAVQHVPSRLETVLGIGGPGAANAPAQALATELPVEQARDVIRTTLDVVETMETRLGSSADLRRDDIRAEVSRRVYERLAPVQALIANEAHEAMVADLGNRVLDQIVAHTIDIPRVMTMPKSETRTQYSDFTLDIERIPKVQPVSDQLLIQEMRTGRRKTLLALRAGDDLTRPEDAILGELMNEYNDISYDDHADLLYRLLGEVVASIRARLKDEKEVESAVICNAAPLAEAVYEQLKKHEVVVADGWETKVSRGFITMRSALDTVPRDVEHVVNFRTAIDPRREIRQYAFEGFGRSLYPRVRFASEQERFFSQLLEDDPACQRWLKPLRAHIEIYYDGDHRYEPDFIVETEQEKLLCEIKRSDEIDDPVVQKKRAAAAQWCRAATEHSRRFSGKPWSYVLIPHDQLRLNSTLKGVVERFRAD